MGAAFRRCQGRALNSPPDSLSVLVPPRDLRRVVELKGAKAFKLSGVRAEKLKQMDPAISRNTSKRHWRPSG